MQEDWSSHSQRFDCGSLVDGWWWCKTLAVSAVLVRRDTMIVLVRCGIITRRMPWYVRVRRRSITACTT